MDFLAFLMCRGKDLCKGTLGLRLSQICIVQLKYSKLHFNEFQFQKCLPGYSIYSRNLASGLICLYLYGQRLNGVLSEAVGHSDGHTEIKV